MEIKQLLLLGRCEQFNQTDYDTFMSIDIKQNDILHEMFTWSETYI